MGDLCQEAAGVDRSIQHAGRCDRVAPERRDERQSLPVAMRHFVHQALSHRTSPVRAGHVRFDPGLINENQACRINLVLMLLPQVAPADDVTTILFAGVQSFF
jgi:hypothetical protein